MHECGAPTILSGFTAGRSTVDALLSLRLLSEIHREFGRPLYAAFVDLKSAFYSVDRSALWKALRGIGTPTLILNLKRTYTGVHTQRFVFHRIHLLPFRRDQVRQGCVLAPVLFCRAFVNRF